MSNIIRFPRRRGRPKAPRVQNDFGTPELQGKRAGGETVEALDLCLARDLITPEQHWCGIHLRWLYTLRYGAPGVRALDHNHISGLEIACDDPAWREAREAEYHEALRRISARGFGPLLTNICIHNERPPFLMGRFARDSASLEQLREGLDLLVKHWRRVKKK